MLPADVDPRLQKYCVVDGCRLHLKIHRVAMSDELLDVAMNAVRRNTNIYSLTLSHLGCGPKMAVVVADMLEHASSLTSCDLSGNAIGSHGSKCLSMSLHANTALRRMSLRQCSLGTDGIVDWVSFVQRGRNTVLDTLDLSCNRIDDEGAALLASALQQLKFHPSPTRRWHFNLVGNAITDAGVAQLAVAMEKCTMVTTMNVATSKAYEIERPERIVFIEHCARRNVRRIGHHVVEESIRAMSQSERSAEVTRLEQVQLREVDCVSLGHALRRTHATTHLILRNNALTLAGLRLLAPSLSLSKSLFSLTIVDNNVGGDGFFALLMALRKNAAPLPLRELHIFNSTATHPLWPRRLNAHIYHTFVQGSTRLTALTLANCGLHDADVAALVAGIAWGCTVERLNLARNHMTDHVLPVFQVLLQRCMALQSLDVVRVEVAITSFLSLSNLYQGGNQCTLSGAVDLVQATVVHPRLDMLRLGRFPCLDDSIFRIQGLVQTTDRLRVLEMSGRHEHSKYAPIMTAIRARLASNNRQSLKHPTPPIVFLSVTGGRDATTTTNIHEHHHVRWCRLQYVGRQVARDTITWQLRPATILSMAERLCMQRHDANATLVLEGIAMTAHDWNVSFVWDQAVEALAMHLCDINVLLVYEWLWMTREDVRF